tara:strand:+ start:441 stop:704 length:264 start_codon:yes stop_codon:yes gene_type:complete
VGTGREVVEAVAREPFDLILLDVQFPGINGFEAVRQLQPHLKQAHPPRIAFLSGHDASDFREGLAELGIHDVLRKPITIEALKGLIS